MTKPETSTKPEARTRDAERTRQAILDAATHLFSQQGYAATGLQQVADTAGVARTTPSYFFGSKEGLWKAVLEAQNLLALNIVPEALAKGGEQATCEELVAALVEAVLDFHVQHPEFLRLMQWSELQENGLIHEVPANEQVVQTAVQAVAAVTKGTPLEREDVRHLVMSIMTACYAPFIFGSTLGIPLGLNVNAPDFQAKWRAHIKHLLLAAIS